MARIAERSRLLSIPHAVRARRELRVPVDQRRALRPDRERPVTAVRNPLAGYTGKPRRNLRKQRVRGRERIVVALPQPPKLSMKAQ